MNASSHRLARALAPVLISFVAVATAVSGVTAAQAADGGSGGIDIAVTTTAKPGTSPSSTPAPGATTPNKAPIVPAAGTGTGTATGGGTTQPAIDTASADTFDLGGVLYISGVRTGFSPSVNPLDGTMDVSFTVKNVSKSTLDSNAELWLTNVFGAGIGSRAEVAVPALKPGESRVVSAPLSGVGQWLLVSAHATFTPPATIDGAEVPPVTRDAVVVVFPWLIVLLAAGSAAGFAAWYMVRRVPLPALTPETA
ncbi:hypothetical protein [Herbiconiux sp. VKM Ac-2851]|uniref:hypothetical protein n=1 Tax=Herbiconiux sp. VKM Ac-2851 TaxID=2739025 RepID=UPI0015667AF0|nr:hypothetical protein [Herbiconiux sp. VKM Ac-2851]NQX36547.1 hypothetical protein [Herbiconiux sp. VKM Ac-2851]